MARRLVTGELWFPLLFLRSGIPVRKKKMVVMGGGEMRGVDSVDGVDGWCGWMEGRAAGG